MHGAKAQLKQFMQDLAFLAKEKPVSAECDVVVCPPFPYLPQAADLLSACQGVSLGAQDVSPHQPGAFTGEVAATMLVDQQCKMVIVGHSERRQYHNESDALIASKFFAAKAAGLTPILCVGETQAQREAGETEKVIKSQLITVLKEGGKAAFQDAIIAYEPVWAIGTGLTASPEQANDIHDLIRQQIGEYDPLLAQGLPILYGGSVKGSNAAALLAMPHINGALVGGASLEANAFWEICQAATQALTHLTQG